MVRRLRTTQKFLLSDITNSNCVFQEATFFFWKRRKYSRRRKWLVFWVIKLLMPVFFQFIPWLRVNLFEWHFWLRRKNKDWFILLSRNFVFLHHHHCHEVESLILFTKNTILHNKNVLREIFCCAPKFILINKIPVEKPLQKLVLGLPKTLTLTLETISCSDCFEWSCICVMRLGFLYLGNEIQVLIISSWAVRTNLRQSILGRFLLSLLRIRSAHHGMLGETRVSKGTVSPNYFARFMTMREK